MAEPRIDEANTAARPARTAAPAPAAPGGPRPARRGVGAGRVVALALSVLVIAFCAWSMGEYVAGRDPLAFLGGSTAGQEGAPGVSGGAAGSGDAAGSPRPDAASGLSADDVADELAGGLSFDGRDLSVPADEVRVVLTDGGVWVEQESRDDAEALVGGSARRAAALGAWVARRAEELGLEVPQVTWVTEDADGVVRMAVSFACDGAPTTGDVSSLLAASRGYRISDDTYAALGDAPFAAEGGEAPTLPGGEALSAGSSVVRQTGSEAPAHLVAEGASPSGPAVGGAGGGASRGATAISVSVSAGSRSATVSLPAGSTALDALRATGASVEWGSNPTGRGGSWVYAIDGLGQEGSHGWTYAVNGRDPGVMSDQCVLSDGDVVVWSYV